MNELVLKQRNKQRGLLSRGMVPLQRLGITEEMIRGLGLREIKQLAKKEYRRRVLESHPDMISSHTGGVFPGIFTLSILNEAIKRVEEFQFVPVTRDNVESLLELTKGFKTTQDVDFGLNGPEDTRGLPP